MHGHTDKILLDQSSVCIETMSKPNSHKRIRCESLHCRHDISVYHYTLSSQLPRHVRSSWWRVKPSGQLHLGPSGVSSHRRSQPPLLTPHEAERKKQEIGSILQSFACMLHCNLLMFWTFQINVIVSAIFIFFGRVDFCMMTMAQQCQLQFILQKPWTSNSYFRLSNPNLSIYHAGLRTHFIRPNITVSSIVFSNKYACDPPSRWPSKPDRSGRQVCSHQRSSHASRWAASPIWLRT